MFFISLRDFYIQDFIIGCYTINIGIQLNEQLAINMRVQFIPWLFSSFFRYFSGYNISDYIFQFCPILDPVKDTKKGSYFNEQMKNSTKFKFHKRACCSFKYFEHAILLIVLMQEFPVYTNTKRDSLHKLLVHQWSLELKGRGNGPKIFAWADVLAIRQIESDSQLAKIEITLFTLKKRFLRSSRRCQESVYFYTNPEEVQRLLKTIRRFITKSDVERPRLLLFHNPVAGANSNQHLEICLEFLGKTHFRWEVIRTEYRGHCRQFLQALSHPEDYWGVVIVSGDGLMHQFVNSLVQIPVVHIPAGSGNAFARTQSQQANEVCGTKENLYLAIKGQTKRFSLTKYTLENLQQPVYSCLSLQWGFMADVDMESEIFRFMGGLRFELYSSWRFLMLRDYCGTLSYSTESCSMPPLDEELPKSYTTVERNFYNAIFCSLPWISDKMNIAPLQHTSSGFMDMQFNLADSGKWELMKYLISVEGGKSFDLEKRQQRPFFDYSHDFIKSFRLIPAGQNKGVFGIDGEKYDAQAVQGEVLKDRMWMFTLRQNQ